MTDHTLAAMDQQQMEAFEAWMRMLFGPELSGVSPMWHERLLEAWTEAAMSERARCMRIATTEAEDQESYGGTDAVGACRSIAAAIKGTAK